MMYISRLYHSRMWGLAAIYAYKAYEEESFLNNAVSIWENTTIWRIRDEDAEQGTHPFKQGTFKSQCNGSKPGLSRNQLTRWLRINFLTFLATNAGGVFYVWERPVASRDELIDHPNRLLTPRRTIESRPGHKRRYWISNTSEYSY